MDAQPTLLDQMIAAGHLIPTGVNGLYGRSGAFEDVIARFEALVTREGAKDEPEVLRFPPAVTRTQLETSGYMKSFPQLAGTVHAFCGDDHDHAALLGCIEAGGDWTKGQVATDVALTPAACYPLYPMMAAQGPLPPEGRLFDVQLEKIRELIAQHAGIPAGAATGDDDDLYRAGMKSFASVQLMLALEEAFEIEFPEEMLNRATFRSATAIARAVSALAPGSIAA